MTIRAYRVTIVLCVCAFSYVHLLYSQVPDDMVILRDNGHPVYVHDLTLLTESQATQALSIPLNDANRTNLEVNHSGYLLPANLPWPGKSGATLKDVYNYDMNGVLGIYINHLVIEALNKKYPLDTSGDYSPAILSKNIAMQAAVDQTFLIHISDAIESNMSNADFLLVMHESFKTCKWDDKTWLNIYESAKSLSAFEVISKRCFPRVLNNKITPWFQYQAEAPFVKYKIEQIISNNLSYYVSLVDFHMSPRPFLIIKNCSKSSSSSVLRLISVLADSDGNMAQGGIEETNKLFAEMGSKVRIDFTRSTLDDMARQYEFSTDGFTPGVLISVKARDGTTFICTMAKIVRHALPSYSSEPGQILYAVAKEDILSPIVDNVLREISVSPPYRIPDRETIIKTISDGVFYTERFGVQFPQPEIK